MTLLYVTNTSFRHAGSRGHLIHTPYVTHAGQSTAVTSQILMRVCESDDDYSHFGGEFFLSIRVVSPYRAGTALQLARGRSQPPFCGWQLVDNKVLARYQRGQVMISCLCKQSCVYWLCFHQSTRAQKARLHNILEHKLANIAYNTYLHELCFLSFLPTTAQRCRSETEKFVLEDVLSSVFSQFKKYHSSGNLEFNHFGIFQSLTFLNGANPSDFS